MWEVCTFLMTKFGSDATNFGSDTVNFGSDAKTWIKYIFFKIKFVFSINSTLITTLQIPTRFPKDSEQNEKSKKYTHKLEQFTVQT